MKKGLVMVLAAAMMIGLMGCGAKDNDTVATTENAKEQTTSGEARQMGFVVSSLDGIFPEFVANMEAECEKYDIEFTTKEATTVNDKITALENFSVAGYDVVLLQVDDADSLSPYVEAAQEKGVKVITLDMETETCDAYFVCPNYEFGYAIGENAANWINENFDPSEKVEVGICNYPSLKFLIEREEGIKAALAEIAPNAEIVATVAAGVTLDEGVSAGENWLQAFPDMKVVAGINDVGPLGVCNAFEAAGKTGDDIGIFGGDAIEDALKKMEEGGIFRGTVSTGMTTLAPDIVGVARDLMENGTTEHAENTFPLTNITEANLQDYLK